LSRNVAKTETPRGSGIACFGEALWDVLPRGIFLGGAPLNVAYHVSRQRVPSRIITAVGRDFLGDEVIRRVTAWGVDARQITRDPRRPTGVVRAQLDARGMATYTIARGAAWDAIVAPRRPQREPSPAVLVYGTLAFREASNRRAFERTLATCPDAVRVLDLNLRAPFDRASVIRWALRRAQVLKLNDEELAHLLAKRSLRPSDLPAATQKLADREGINRICVTAGARGAGLWWDGTWKWEPGRPVAVRDTVGAGDAFLAALLVAVFDRGLPPAVALQRACRLGEFVASRDGATPAYQIDANGRPQDGA
jgi:fructokinase